MTSAPKSLNIMPQNGPGARPAISTTLIPLRAIAKVSTTKTFKCKEGFCRLQNGLPWSLRLQHTFFDSRRACLKLRPFLLPTSESFINNTILIDYKFDLYILLYTNNNKRNNIVRNSRQKASNTTISGTKSILLFSCELMIS